MAQILRFMTPAMRERENVLKELRALAEACGMTWEYFTACACGEGKTWDDRPLEFLYGPLNLLRAEVEKLKSKAAPLAVPARRASVVSFPTPPEALAHMEKENKAQKKGAKQAKPVAVASPAPALQADLDGRRSAEKARYIQRVKMLQRDCEKALPRFDDDTYRAILQEQFGAASSKDLNATQLRVLLMYMKGLLQDAKGGAAKCSFDTPALLYHDPAGLDRERLMRRIGAALKEKGAREGKYVPWNYALAILKNVSGKVVTEWNDALPVNLKAVIAALHSDAKRKGRRTR